MNEKYNALFNTFKQPDPHSFGVFKMLQDFYPEFAEKIFDDNKVMERIVMYGHNSMDILQYPICGHCETLAAYDGYGHKYGKLVKRCTCFKCGHSTNDPVIFRTWILDELKKKAPADIAESLDYAVDMVAEKMVAVAMEQLRATVMTTLSPKPMLVDSKGNPIQEPEPIVKHDTPFVAPKDTVYITEDGGQSDVQ